ncbi:MAG: alpha-hydroxy-acid oxidizing protein [Chloroflexi bacterium]|nr:alpha-hydroxy-acid oxidizing protein [Chloroflexota bacterium]
MADELLARLDPAHYATVARLLLSAPIAGWVDAGDAPPSDARGAFERLRLLPRVLRSVAEVHTATTLLGSAVRAPIGIAPIGIQGALHPDGERATARGAAAAGSIAILPVNATTSIEDVRVAAPDATLWFQLYAWPDRGALAEVVARAEAAGCRALVPLVNTPVVVPHVPASVGFRLPAGMELAHGAGGHGLDATLDPTWLEWLAGISRLPVVPKGVMHPEDARRAVDAGARGVIVSDHGGRQLPRSVATIDALPAVAEAVGDRAEVYLDGGIRTGTDVLFALARGARAVFVGRAACWGLAVGGAEGVRRVLERLREELVRDAATCGIADLASIPEDLVVAPAPRTT